MAEDQAFPATFLEQNCTPELPANPLIGRAILSIPASYQYNYLTTLEGSISPLRELRSR